jgi:hypothetical protein
MPIPSPAALPVAPIYSDKDIDAIIRAVGRFPSETMLYVQPGYLYLVGGGSYGPVAISRRDALEGGIQYAAKVYLGERRFDKSPTDLKLYREHKNAILQCKTLADMLYNQRGSLSGGLILSVTKEPACPNVQEMLADLLQLQEWLTWRATNIQPLEIFEHGGNRRKSLASLDLWVRYLADIYRYVFDRDPAFSVSVDVDTQDTGGPFARYLDFCIRPILGDATPTPQALRSRFRRLQKKDGHFKL